MYDQPLTIEQVLNQLEEQPGAIASLTAALQRGQLQRRPSRGEWSVNEQYSYGWFVPFFVVLLFWLRWQDRPRVNFKIRTSKFEIAVASVAALSLLLLLPLRLFEIGNPDWRPLGWLHAAVVVNLLQ